MKQFLSSYLKKEASPAGLALFRICYGITLFLEVLQLYQFKPLIFDVVSYWVVPDYSVEYILLAWLFTIICLIVGFQTKIATVVNYVLTLLTFSTFQKYEYHIDYIYILINFILIITPINYKYSIDRFLSQSKKESDTGNSYKKVYRVHYDILIFLAIGLVYFDSVFFKFHTVMWMNGLGVWLPASLPHATYTTFFSFLLDYKWLMIFLSHLTLGFETIFIFLMWFRSLRWLLFIIGFGLHLGIFFFFPIPLFAYAMLSFYILVIPPDFVESIVDKAVQWLKKVTGFLKFEKLIKEKQGNRLSRLRELFTADLLQSNQKLNRNISTVLAIIVLFVQLTIIAARYPELIDHGSWKYISRSSSNFQKIIKKPARAYLGLVGHGVFVDRHFTGYNHILAVVHIDPKGNERWLPIITEEGLAGDYLRGRMWACWSFRVSGPIMNPTKLKSGIRNFTLFWATENHVPMMRMKMDLRVKEIDIPTEWSEGFYHKQIKKPWRKCGEVYWDQRKCTITLEDLEEKNQNIPEK
jgi:HTTM domain